jgi:hypothetical protein
MLNDSVSWSSLINFNKNNIKYHSKTIYNEFNKWSKNDIFKNAFYNFINTNYFKISKIKKNTCLRLRLLDHYIVTLNLIFLYKRNNILIDHNHTIYIYKYT